jgi:hypothetical protein
MHKWKGPYYLLFRFFFNRKDKSCMIYRSAQQHGYRSLRGRKPTLQRQFRLYIPFLGIAWPQPHFSHSCVCERFIYSQDWSTYFLQQKRQTHRGNTVYNSLTDTWMWKSGLRPRYSFSWNICFKFSAFCLCSVQYVKPMNNLRQSLNITIYKCT